MNESKKAFSVLLVGVGGQGVLWLSKLIAAAACYEYPFVCRTEMRGLSQRGGTVSSEVRFGLLPVVPLVGSSTEDLLIAMDGLEGARALEYLSPDGSLLTNRHFTPPAHVLARWKADGIEAQGASALQTSLSKLWFSARGRYALDIAALVTQVQDSSPNVIMAGAASGFLPIAFTTIRTALMAALPNEHHGSAERALNLGRDAAKQFHSFTLPVAAA